MAAVFKLITSALSIYTFMCFIRIIITWFPGLSYSSLGRFLASFCDPFLDFFKKVPLRFGAFDFTPLLAFGVLMIATNICASLSMNRVLSLGTVLAMLISQLWSIIASLLSFLLIVLVVRLLVIIFSKNSYSNIWNQIDYTLNPMVMKLTSVFSTGAGLRYQTALIIAVIELVAIRIGANIVISILCGILAGLPF